MLFRRLPGYPADSRDTSKLGATRMLADRVHELLSLAQSEQAAVLVQAQAAAAPPDELDAIALSVARMFMRGDIDYNAASSVICPIWDAKLEAGALPPPVAYEIYWALDRGEYASPGHSPDEDPVEYHVKPALAAILAKHGA
jgi:hypothetical protein